MVSATVIVCTHNRAAVVARALEGALAQAVPAGAEVLAVDNASTDDTPAALAALSRMVGPRLRVIREPLLGLSAARNRGLAEARGEIAVFLDDDAVPRPGWLKALLAPFAARRVACAGGRIVVRFPAAQPSWFRTELSAALSGFDLGNEARQIRYGQPGDLYPYGANIAFRAMSARSIGGFCSLVGLHGRHLLTHEETDLCYRLEEAGWEVRYTPQAVVDHLVSHERVTPEWLLRRHAAGGRSAALFVLRNRGILRALWRVRWLYGASLVARPYTPREPVDAMGLVRECRRQEALGYLAGLGAGIRCFRSLRRGRMTALPPAVARPSAGGQAAEAGAT
jgi:GT2 family glycosyltransferase